MVVNMKEVEDAAIGRKISAERFVRILGETSRVEISESILKQSKSIGLIINALETAAREGVSDIVITRRGKVIKTIKGRMDPIDPFVRAQVGYRPDAEERLIVFLLERGDNFPISGLSPSEINLLPKLEREGHLQITKGRMTVGLTKLGGIVARGAKKMYPEFWE